MRGLGMGVGGIWDEGDRQIVHPVSPAMSAGLTGNKKLRCKSEWKIVAMHYFGDCAEFSEKLVERS